jgi:MerR family transcriptional regulator/heat shock protein HspR
MSSKRRTRRTIDGYTISAVAERYGLHPQTLRLYEREGLLKPFRSDGNTRYYSDADLERLETILSLTRDMGVNLAGVEVILNLREQMDRMRHEMEEFLRTVQSELDARIAERMAGRTDALVPWSHVAIHRRVVSLTQSATRRTVQVRGRGDEAGAGEPLESESDQNTERR